MKKILNGQSLPLSSLAPLDFAAFSNALEKEVSSGKRVCAYFGVPGADKNLVECFAVLADDKRNQLLVGRSVIEGGSFPSLALRCPQVHLFEREIAEQFGLKAVGHPWFKPVRYVRSWTGLDAWDRPSGEEILPACGDFYRVEGQQIHEVGVGPVHA